ncbi:MAG: nucleoside monophosphate kinase [Candidatus Gracilibacteria bacterium]|nr:nucleoside monophosphate kinase [Candidatus Gracilibacteria bacterium]
MKLVFTGIQGCGKGTQARLLVEKYGFTLLEMGQELRKIASSDTELGKRVKQTIDSGALVTPEVVGEIMNEVITTQTNENLILDGFVRNEGNKKSLEEITMDYKVVFFELSKEKAIGRLLGRMYDPISGETFLSGTIVNPVTGTKLEKRKDDNEASILKRIDEFMNNTLPTALKQETEGKVIRINADQDVDSVFKELVTKLGL